MKHFRRVLYVLGVALALTTSAKAPDPARSAELFDQAAAELDLRRHAGVFPDRRLVEGLLGKIKDVAGRIAERGLRGRSGRCSLAACVRSCGPGACMTA